MGAIPRSIIRLARISHRRDHFDPMARRVGRFRSNRGDADPGRSNRDRQWGGRGQGPSVRREGLFRDSLRGRTHGRSALARAAAGPDLEGRLSRRPDGPRMHSGFAPSQPQSLFRGRGDQRGLPVSEPLGERRRQTRRRPARGRLDLWRRLHARLQRHGDVQRRKRRQERRDLRQLQLPGRRARQYGAS